MRPSKADTTIRVQAERLDELMDRVGELVTLTDDGRSLDRERIRAKAVERGLIDASVDISDAAPLFGRIAAITDVFDALTSERPYKSAWSPEEAKAAIIEASGAL